MSHKSSLRPALLFGAALGVLCTFGFGAADMAQAKTKAAARKAAKPAARKKAPTKTSSAKARAKK